MARRIAAFACIASLVSASLCSAQSVTEKDARPALPKVVDKYDGPLRRASLSGARMPVPAPVRSKSADDRPSGSWMERHPALSGALLGFGLAFGLTYAVTAGDDDNALLSPVDSGGPALVYGGIGAGLGALAGWGISRNR
jgi:hypothetical protein